MSYTHRNECQKSIYCITSEAIPRYLQATVLTFLKYPHVVILYSRAKTFITLSLHFQHLNNYIAADPFEDYTPLRINDSTIYKFPYGIQVSTYCNIVSRRHRCNSVILLISITFTFYGLFVFK